MKTKNNIQRNISNYLLISILLQIPLLIYSISIISIADFGEIVVFSIFGLTSYEFSKARKNRLFDRRMGISIILIYVIYNLYLILFPKIGMDGSNVNFINEYPYVFLIEKLFELNKTYPYLAMLRSFAIILIFISLFENFRLLGNPRK